MLGYNHEDCFRSMVGEFVIFENQQSKKFVQVVLLEDELLCDVPLSELSREEGNKLKSLSSKNIGEMYEGSYNLWFKLDEIKQATEWVDKILPLGGGLDNILFGLAALIMLSGLNFGVGTWIFKRTQMRAGLSGMHDVIPRNVRLKRRYDK